MFLASDEFFRYNETGLFQSIYLFLYGRSFNSLVLHDRFFCFFASSLSFAIFASRLRATDLLLFNLSRLDDLW